MAAVSANPDERARKMLTMILQGLQDPGRAVSLASAMGVSETTFSRLRSDHLPNLCALLAHMGLKVVPLDRVSVDPDTYRALCHIATKAMARPEIADLIVMEDD